MSRIPAGIEAGRGLVEHQQARTPQQRRGDSQALAHPVREAAYAMGGPRGQLDDLQHLVDAFLGPISVERGQQLEVLARGEIRIEAWRLDESGDTLQRPCALAHRVAPEQLDSALARHDQPEGHPQRRRLACAIRSEEAVDIADA